MINKMTVRFRLWALMVDWCEFDLSGSGKQGVVALIGDAAPYEHVLVLLMIPPVLLTASVALLRWSEFTSAAESDV